jgi:hypothetical protein
MKKSPVFEQTYKDYLTRIAGLNLKDFEDKLGGYTPTETFAYDVFIKIDVLPKVPLFIKIDVLPKVPLLLLFNDKDEEFPAQCAVLFEKRTEKYLDMECVAMVGMLLYEYLKVELIDVQ